MTNARLEELRSKFQENPRRYFAPYANELRKAGDTAQAISVCRAHLSSQPGHVSGHIVLGQALYEAGEAAEARDIFSAALELDPENLIALRTLGEIAQVNGEFAMARQWYERLLDADPRNADVAQLLNDLPTDAPTALEKAEAEVAANPVVEEPAAEPLPFNAKPDADPAPPVPSFHTSFTGSERAFVESTAAEATEPEVEVIKPAPRLDFGPPSSPPPIETVSAASAEAPADALDMVDLDSFDAPAPEAEPVAAHAVPDESSDEPSFEVSDDRFEMHAESPAADEEPEFTEPVSSEFAEPVSSEFAEPAAASEAPEAVELPEVEAEIPAPEPAPEEPPRAVFAEFGFDGRADDQVGWAATPSASYSELETAPEEWFDERPSTPEPEEVESRAEEPTAAQESEPDQSTDSWFDEVEGASMIEATEVASDEFWLPPDLHRASPTDVVAQPESPQAEVPAPSHAAEPEPVEATAETQEPEKIEYDRFDVEIAAEAAEDAVVVERPFDIAPSSYWLDSHAEASETSVEQPAEETVEEERVAQAEAPESFAPAEQASEPITASSSFESAGEVERVEPMAGMMDFVAPPVNESMAPPAAVGHASIEPEEPSAPAAPFVTETLAELYLQQGFRDEALSIYRQLSERNPDDANLRNRIASIEQGEAPAAQPAAAAPVENRAAAQSVRTFFSRLARRPAVTPPAALQESARSNPDVPFAAAASALANLFAASKPPATDEGAASTLAGAFTDPAGRPTRAADRELSLDHLFRDVPPGGQASGGVSLDEFYANPNAQPGSPTEPGEASESPESGGTDIRQFTAWLEGLRKK